MSTDYHDLPQDPPNDDVLAGEYVLGVLDAEARRAFAARLARDPALAREVAAWQQRLAPLLDQIEPVVPPLGLWHRIRTHVGLSQAPSAAAPLPVWERLNFWRGVSVAGFAATAASLLALVATQRPPHGHEHMVPHPITMVASMTQADGARVFMTAVDADACTLLLMPMPDAKVPAGKVPELWLLASNGPPHSLGVSDSVHTQAFVIPVALRAGLKPDTKLAVSIEPHGGSPTGAPTGDVIAAGSLITL